MSSLHYLPQLVKLLLFISLLSGHQHLATTHAQTYSIDNNDPCQFSDLSPSISTILCTVEEGRWLVPETARALKESGCLIGGNRCESPLQVPTESQIPPSPPPPDSRNKQYQILATTAEQVVPQTWWRKGFSNDLLLLTHNDSDLPRKQFDAKKSTKNKKLKNLLQCVTRQQFIRKSFAFESALQQDGGAAANPKAGRCIADTDPVVIHFQEIWLKSPEHGGALKKTSTGHLQWEPATEDGRQMLVSALAVLDHFYTNYGNVWTGCFKFEKSAYCRGALAAASQVVAMHLLYDIAGPSKDANAMKRKEFTESDFVSGYMLASIGRGVLHGDTLTTGSTPITAWKVRLNDFTALQAAYLKLYIQSFGAQYTQQVNQYVPFAFPPTFPVHAKSKWRKFAQSLEPVYTSLRNWMFTEAASLIDFGPYRPLAAFDEVRKEVKNNGRRRVLIDVGANGFYASPKYLLDSYAPYLPFTHAIMIEPEPHFSASVPAPYSKRYNISYLPIYAEVNTNSDVDMLRLLPSLVSKDDFVVLKFDVDPNR
jgi:hypothetical protein